MYILTPVSGGFQQSSLRVQPDISNILQKKRSKVKSSCRPTELEFEYIRLYYIVFYIFLADSNVRIVNIFNAFKKKLFWNYVFRVKITYIKKSKALYTTEDIISSLSPLSKQWGPLYEKLSLTQRYF